MFFRLPWLRWCSSPHSKNPADLDLPRGDLNNTALFRASLPARSQTQGSILANIQSAKKRARQNVRRRTHNMTLRSRLRSAVRKVLLAVQKGDKDAAQAGFKAAVPEIDRMVTKGIIRKNRAARYKHRLNARVKALS